MDSFGPAPIGPHPEPSDPSDDEIDRLVAGEGGPSGWFEVAELVDRIREEAAVEPDAQWVRTHVAAAAAAARKANLTPDPTAGRSSRPLRVGAVAAATTTLVATMGFAAADTLPVPLQSVAAHVASLVGVAVPDGRRRAPEPPPAPTSPADPAGATVHGGPGPGPSAPTTRPPGREPPRAPGAPDDESHDGLPSMRSTATPWSSRGRDPDRDREGDRFRLPEGIFRFGPRTTRVDGRLQLPGEVGYPSFGTPTARWGDPPRWPQPATGSVPLGSGPTNPPSAPAQNGARYDLGASAPAPAPGSFAARSGGAVPASGARAAGSGQTGDATADRALSSPLPGYIPPARPEPPPAEKTPPAKVSPAPAGRPGAPRRPRGGDGEGEGDDKPRLPPADPAAGADGG